MQRLFAVATVLLLGCASARHSEQHPTPVWVRSHNVSAVDVYLFCGDRDPQRLGTVDAGQSDQFEIPTSRAYCFQGLNFFLVVRRSRRGYWVGPFLPERAARVELVIEKYAGLSSAGLVR